MAGQVRRPLTPPGTAGHVTASDRRTGPPMRPLCTIRLLQDFAICLQLSKKGSKVGRWMKKVLYHR